MTLVQRFKMIMSALLTILCAVLLIEMEEDGYLLVSLLLSLSLIVSGIRFLIYYFTMARHMVDGRGVFYKAVIVLDFGIFTLSVSRNYGFFIVLYLLVVRVFSGVMDILRAMEAKRFQAPWRMTLAEGIVNLAFAAAAVVFGIVTGNLQNLTRIYTAGLFYSAAMQLVSAFRKTAIVYIP